MFEVNQKVKTTIRDDADEGLNILPVSGTVVAVFPERPYAVLVLADDGQLDRSLYPVYTDADSGTGYDYSFTAEGQFIDGLDSGASIVAVE